MEWKTWRWVAPAAAAGAMALAATQAVALERPPWMDDDGIVLAESWRSPAHRARALGKMDLILPATEEEGFRREHSVAMMEELKKLGVTTVLTHYYEGFGSKAEDAGMKDARYLAREARKAGLRVGAYIGGTLGWESLSKEVREAGAWQAATPDGEPMLDDPKEPFRRVAAFLRPAYSDHLERVLRRMVMEMQPDFVYFDHVGLGNDSWDKFTAGLFHDFLTERGFKEAIRVKLPPTAAASEPLGRAWVDFRIKSTVEHFRRLSRFVRSLDAQCAVVCNPGGVNNDSMEVYGVDHSQLLAFSHAFRGETTKPGWSDNRAVTRIRSLKTGQAFGNATLLDCESPLELAESLAFNLHSLGNIAWFENGHLLPPRARIGRISSFMEPYLEFFRTHTEFYRIASRATDVAVLRPHETFAHGSEQKRRAISDAEQALIESQTPFAILFDQNWDSLDAHHAVITPDESDLSAAQRRQLDIFRARGGEVIPAATLQGDPQRARDRLRERLRVQVTAPAAVAAEVTERRMVPQVLVHLVNYRIDQPVKNIPVTVQASRLSRPLQAEYWNPLNPNPTPLKLTRNGNQLQVTVPHLDIYGLVVFTGAML
ncbi:MAG: hypothetical protein WA117_20655 [Verrucomicrobiia bacterium]